MTKEPKIMTKELIQNLCDAQKDEITSYHIYNNLAKIIKNQENAKILTAIGKNELEHYNELKKYTNKSVKPDNFKVFIFTFLARVLGLTFSLKFMENGERKAEKGYKHIGILMPEVEKIMHEEEIHEKKLINMINEEGLNYMGSIVLGLNDALVELTGALAGFTLALQNSRLIAMLGLITGISAALSMSASEFLSQRQEENEQDAVKSSLYTGIAYIITVVLLVMPFFIFENYFINLGITMSLAILIILLFNFYISVAKDLPFKRRFLEMLAISLSVAAISFGIGWFVRAYFHLDI
ncbi:MAG: VIT1/CCC1 transporter family protein [bacterium]